MPPQSLSRDGTDPFLPTYLEYVGESEVPSQYHLWCGLSLLAAAVSNRVWVVKGRPLAPNLYTMLVGPSAIGKNEAIETMLTVVRDQRRINAFRGKMTAPAMLDRMVKPDLFRPVPWSHFYLVTPELSWSFGHGDWSEMLVKQLTELYGGSVDALQEITRMHGLVRVPPGALCINWLSGSTQEWLNKTFPADMISGGFVGRIVGVYADYDFATRFHHPIYPEDRDFLLALLRARIARLAKLEGEAVLTPEANEVDRWWYEHRDEPTNEDQFAGWKRQHDLVLKLAVLLSLSDSDSLVVTPAHVAAAQRLSDQVLHNAPRLMATQMMSVETRGLQVAEAYFRRFTDRVPHSLFINHMSKRGYDADSCARLVRTLEQMTRLTTHWVGKRREYVYHGRRRLQAQVAAFAVPLLPTNGNGHRPPPLVTVEPGDDGPPAMLEEI